MQSLIELPTLARSQIIGILTDIDDTLTTEGHLTAAAYTAPECLHAAGFKVIPTKGVSFAFPSGNRS